MTAIRIRTTLASDTPHLPELKPLVGRRVEIVVTEEPPAPADDVRAEFHAVVDPTPRTPEEFAARQAAIRRWQADPRFRAYWPQLPHMLEWDYEGFLDHRKRWDAAQEAVRWMREHGTYDYDAQADQDAVDRREAEKDLG